MSATTKKTESRRSQAEASLRETKEETLAASSAGKRPRVLCGQTIKIKTGCGALYVTINRLGDKFYELFARAGKAGGCAASQCEAIGRLIFLAWRKGATAEEVVEQLRGITCQRLNEKDSEQARSCADGVAKAIQMVLSNEE